MDVLALSRLQFAVATYFHFLFVPLTLGLSLLVAIMQTVWYRTGDEEYKRMAKFWGKLFLINFAIGVVTGITLEFQFGTNWSRYSAFVGDVFGSLLAIEATVAFFLESTFIAVWFFGWNRISKKAHLASIWIVAIASNISAFWILVANAWMQSPTGYAIRNGRAELTDFFAVITQRFALLEVVHTLGGAYITAGFFVLGISAWHLLRKRETDFFTKSFRLAAVWTLVFSVLEVAQGHMNAEILGTKQPIKLAAMEAQWETEAGAPLNLLQWPDAANERNAVQALPVPGLLSLLAHYDAGAEVVGLRSVPPDQRPPVLPVFLSFRIMVGLAFLFIALSLWATLRRRAPAASPLLLRILPWTIPLPYLANELGWTLAEVGRQPWIVYGIMRTSEAVSPIGTPQVAISALGFIVVYTLLGIADFYLLFTYARKGPAPVKA
jgi:cytochrome d ubiquinol oxidase subunit I